MKRTSRKCAFICYDLMIALILAGIMAATLALAIGQQKRGGRLLAEHRAALSRAEQALAQLQSFGTMQDSVDVAVTRLNDPAPEGFLWVTVTARVQERSASLTGLVPRGGAQ